MGQIVAMGGGGFSMEPDDPRMDRFVLSLARRRRPRVGFLSPNSSSDYAERFLHAFGQLDCEPVAVSLFPPPTSDLLGFFSELDVVYVGGGATKSMLAVWREWELPAILRRLHQEDLVLAGPSCGACCWFEATVSDSVVPGALAPLRCIGLAPGSLVPHYDAPGRREGFHAAVGGGLPVGLGVDDGAAAHLVDGELVEVVTTRDGATAWQVVWDGGAVVERRLAARTL